MANPFYVEPTALKGLSGIAQVIGEKRAQDQQLQRQEQMLGEINRAIQSGDADLVAKTSLKYPELSQQIQGAFNFKNDQTKQNMLAGMQRIVAGEDPEAVLTERINFVQSQGGDPSDTIQELATYRSNPQGYKEKTEARYAMIDPKGHQAYRSTTTDKTKDVVKPTANIQDFEKWQSMEEGPEKDAFAKLIRIAPEPNAPTKPTTPIQNFEYWKELPEGPEKDAFARAAGIDPKMSEKDQIAKIERVEEKKNEILTANSTIDMIDRFLSNDSYIDVVTGFSGKNPITIMPESVDAEAALDSLVDSLTLENLSRMSGVLTDKDIELLKNASAGIKKGMSKKALTDRLNYIKKQISNKVKRVTEGIPVSSLSQQAEPEVQTSIVIQGHPQYGDITEDDIQQTMRANNMTREQVMAQLGG